MAPPRSIDMHGLSQFFNMPEKAVAKELGICLTSLKKICRNNGVHRWPYRKVKSMDKKLRKLEGSAAGSDGASILENLEMEGDLSASIIESLAAAAGSPLDIETSSERECTASNATTPRGLEYTSSSGSSSPREELCVVPETEEIRNASFSSASNDEDGGSLSSFESVPVKFCKSEDGQPIKLELSLPPEMLKQMAGGAQNITFVVQGMNESAQHLQVAAQRVDSHRQGDVKVAKSQQDVDLPAALSDEDLIAMLADCAAPSQPRQDVSFAEVIQDRNGVLETGAAARAMEPSDAELMAALAGCCGGQNPFNPPYGGQTHDMESELYHDDDVSSWTCYPQSGGGMDDSLVIIDGGVGAVNVAVTLLKTTTEEMYMLPVLGTERSKTIEFDEGFGWERRWTFRTSARPTKDAFAWKSSRQQDRTWYVPTRQGCQAVDGSSSKGGVLAGRHTIAGGEIGGDSRRLLDAKLTVGEGWTYPQHQHSARSWNDESISREEALVGKGTAEPEGEQGCPGGAHLQRAALPLNAPDPL
eukprot:CAMPEP_0181319588 /NCGR_PEP_ID=MMETSP1101-20121128/17658_1 /TAXON_ID=46948 /ORGANISM="Rhodomonas abbreviata, Strain Caron Lab Isolate" /LENGTH=529 /DNA_ID=CAMNT_0023427211 /DNA_START=138 /DNA_END=1730 /DNA_ORIENTATION=-